MAITTATVTLWGTDIGVVALDDADGAATFQYTPEFTTSGIEVSPITMPLRAAPYRFAALSAETFHGLPGLLADSLPDSYGNKVIARWLARQGRQMDDFSVVERLCYQGNRGMGALEFTPARTPDLPTDLGVDIADLVDLATAVLSDREHLVVDASPAHESDAMNEILSVGTSAGGARAKAVVAWNRATMEFRSGQVPSPPGFQPWLIKFDGVAGSGDHGLADPDGFGAIEYAYCLMATAAGVTMAPCHLLQEGGRRHFMTQRFDRTADGAKRHMQTLGSLAHLDYNQPDANSYEQAFLAMRQLELPAAQRIEQFRRMVFNIVARNQDDHVKNISFLMDRRGAWELSPAYDITYSYRPSGGWTAQHQMSINGRRDGFTVADLREIAKTAGLKRGAGDDLLAEVVATVQQWPQFAAQAGVAGRDVERIGRAHRLSLPAR